MVMVMSSNGEADDDDHGGDDEEEYDAVIVLLACGLALSDLPASLAGLWQSALASRFIFLCGLCIVALNVGSPYLLEEVPQPLALLGPGVCLLGVAVLQICLSEAMAMPAPSSRTLQALLLGLMAAVLHAAAGVPKGKAAPIPPAAKATPRLRLGPSTLSSA
eukprot:s1867_g4.t1